MREALSEKVVEAASEGEGVESLVCRSPEQGLTWQCSSEQVRMLQPRCSEATEST